VLKKQATAEDIQNFGADYVILATGASMEPPPFDDGATDRVLTAIQVLNGMEPQGERILMMGGGVIGCETAVWLAEKGSKVTIIEMLPEIALDFVPPNRNMLLTLLNKNNVKIQTNTIVQEVGKEKIIAMDKNFRQYSISCDQVAIAPGQKPKKELYENVMRKIPETYAIGDCLEPRNIHFAIWDGYAVGCSI